MFTWLVLLALLAFAIQQNSRLRRLEKRIDELQPVGYDSFVEWGEPVTAEAPAEPTPIGEVDEQRQPAIAIHAEEPRPVAYSEPVHAIVDEEVAEERSPPWQLSNGFEELFGRRLPIWAGGITLAVAGMLIVKLSIESGLLTPPIRFAAGLIFGTLLMAAAEIALRIEERIRDPRVRQALAGAGVATLYASILVAVNLYHLIGPVTAMIGMAVVTALALFLSIRFGAPSALLGLAGGLAAPALVGSTEPNVPLLSIYLALAVSGLCVLSRSQRWAWLGVSALVGGFGWGVILLVGGVLDTPSSISLGLYLLLLGVGIPALGFAGERKDQLQLVAGIVAAAQMAALVATGGFALINWGLFAMLAIASAWLAQRDAILARIPPVGLLVALLLLAAWTSPAVGNFTLVMSGCVLIYGAPALRRLWHSGSLTEAAEIGALGLGALLIPMLHFHHSDGSNDVPFGLLAAGLSLAVGACLALGWKVPDRTGDARFALLGTVTATLLAATAVLLLPIWVAGVAVGAIGLGLLRLGQVADDPRFEPMAWIFAAAGFLTYPYSQIADGKSFPDPVDTVHWGLQAAIAGIFAWRAQFAGGRSVAQFLAPAFLYFAIASTVAERFEPLIAPVLLIATAWLGRRVNERMVPGLASSLTIIAAWALSPLLLWITGAADSPMLVTDVPNALDALTKLAIPGAAIAAAILIIAPQFHNLERMVAWTAAGTLAAVGVHSLYKQLFAIATESDFVVLGLAERTIWEVAIGGLALLAFQMRKRILALGLAIAAAAHLSLYTLLLHNPLWAAQAVGEWPIANLVLPVYALALAVAEAVKRAVRPMAGEVARGLGAVQIVLAVLFAFTELRQLFHGTMLVAPGLPAAEDILRSILAIALAIGFLMWGIARQQRDWRIASLVLMLAAVGKVFLFDASGLEGVTRIASFVALGMSLIGIGWLYSRHLGSDRAALSGA